MKPIRLSFLALATWLVIVQVDSTSGATPGPDEPRGAFDRQLAELDLMWKTGQRRDYYLRASKIADSLQAQSRGTANVAALDLLSAVQAKKPATTQEALATDVTDLLALTKLTRFLLVDDSMSLELRQRKVRVLAKLLGQVRQELVPHYVEQRVVLNVQPPPGVFGMAGMDPAAITDPVARRQYEAAILENQAKGVQNSRQATLQDMHNELARPIIQYLSRAARTEPAITQTVQQSVGEARLTDKEKAEVLRFTDN